VLPPPGTVEGRIEPQAIEANSVAKDLIIVESPAKTRTLKKFLGNQYTIEASRGHIRDLVKKDMGIGPNFEPHYEILADKKDVVKALRSAAKKADNIYLAPDPDREGEAIAWHIAEVLNKKPEQIHRVTFNEITKRAVIQALEQPRQIDEKRVDAQQARRILDRLMGFRLSPLLWDKVRQGLSAGRVQSVALKMVCDREAQIEAFVAEEYWIIGANVEASRPPAFNVKLHQIDGKKAKVENGDQSAEIVEGIQTHPLSVAALERKESRQRPQAPFITSRLQQEAARRFSFSVKRTMGIAQGLYEGREIGDRGQIGLITYMRTDSTRIADEALTEVREVIKNTYGEGDLPAKPQQYGKNKKGAQDAHECIRPTTFDLPPNRVKAYLDGPEWKLYKLIWDRFVASQMKPAVYDVTQVDVAAGPEGRYTLRVSGKVLKNPGFLKVYQEVQGSQEDGADDGAAATAGAGDLPPLLEGEKLQLLEVTGEQKFTQPPARFSEATLVRALEENGIGRPSTYATILATLSDRNYAERLETRFHPTALGRVVNQLLQESFNELINEGYTASLEKRLDRIEEGDLGWKEALADFDKRFQRFLEVAAKEMPDVKRQGIPTDESCPECNSPLVLRFGRYGGFYGCTNYPDCEYTRDARLSREEAEKETEEEANVPPCEECGQPMVKRRSRYGTFYGCSAYPECKNIRKPEGEQPKDTGVTCPECNEGTIQEKKSRRGKVFYSCSRYPQCKYALWNKPIDRPCPQCGAPFLVEKTTKKAGTRLLCQEKECDYEEILSGPGGEPVATPGAEVGAGVS
jgi:DNA topoisomerase-1